MFSNAKKMIKEKNKTDRKIRSLMNKLKKDDSVVVIPTDKTIDMYW